MAENKEPEGISRRGLGGLVGRIAAAAALARTVPPSAVAKVLLESAEVDAGASAPAVIAKIPPETQALIPSITKFGAADDGLRSLGQTGLFSTQRIQEAIDSKDWKTVQKTVQGVYDKIIGPLEDFYASAGVILEDISKEPPSDLNKDAMLFEKLQTWDSVLPDATDISMAGADKSLIEAHKNWGKAIDDNLERMRLKYTPQDTTNNSLKTFFRNYKFFMDWHNPGKIPYFTDGKPYTAQVFLGRNFGSLFNEQLRLDNHIDGQEIKLQIRNAVYSKILGDVGPTDPTLHDNTPSYQKVQFPNFFEYLHNPELDAQWAERNLATSLRNIVPDYWRNKYQNIVDKIADIRVPLILDAQGEPVELNDREKSEYLIKTLERLKPSLAELLQDKLKPGEAPPDLEPIFEAPRKETFVYDEVRPDVDRRIEETLDRYLLQVETLLKKLAARKLAEMMASPADAERNAAVATEAGEHIPKESLLLPAPVESAPLDPVITTMGLHKAAVETVEVAAGGDEDKGDGKPAKPWTKRNPPAPERNSEKTDKTP